MPRRSNVRVYVHYVWTTWDRLPLITPDIQKPIYKVMLAKCQELGAYPLALGGIVDHVHFLVRLPAALTIARCIGEIKGASAHAATHAMNQPLFKWQGAYGAFSVGERELAIVQSYIQHQAEHHHLVQSCSEIQALDKEDDSGDAGDRTNG